MSAAFDFRKCKRLLLSSLAVSALYRGPRGILCTRGEKEYASIRQPTAACDNRLVKNEAYDDSPRKFICAEDVEDKKITQSFDCVILVDVNGLEPLTFSTSRRHSTS